MVALLLAYLPSLVLACLVFRPLPAFGQQLQGGIQHEEQVAPTPPQYREGASFRAEAKIDEISWYQIPSWLAGTFKTSTAKVRLVTKYANGPSPLSFFQFAHSKQIYGRQLDARGEPWEAELLPYIQKWSFLINHDRQVVVEKRPLRVEQDIVVLKLHTYDVVLGPMGNFILRSAQLDAIKTITRTSKGIHVHNDLMTYASDGKRKYRFTQDYDGKRTAAFVPVDFERGTDLKQAFADYLNRHGHPELVPPRAGELKP